MAKQVYPLTSLLQVREFREEAAQKEFTKAKKIRDDAEHALNFAKKTLLDYQEWRLLEEKRRYDAIMGVECTKKDLDALKHGIALLLAHEFELEKAVQDAEKALQEKEKIMQECKALFIQMQKDKEKIIAHKELWQEEVLHEQARLEDLELEDFKAKANDFA